MTKPPSRAARAAISAILLGTGVLHFREPEFFDALIPEELPAKRALTYGSGVVEVALGAAMAVKPTRTVGWTTVALFVAIFPANINQAVRNVQPPGLPPVPRWASVARLPLQGLLIWGALAATREPGPPPPR